DLTRSCGLHQPAWSVDDLIERFSSRQARENNVCSLAERSRRSGWFAADVFEFGKGAAPIAENLIACGEKMFGNFGPDSSHPDKADGLHAFPPSRLFCASAHADAALGEIES